MTQTRSAAALVLLDKHLAFNVSSRHDVPGFPRDVHGAIVRTSASFRAVKSATWDRAGNAWLLRRGVEPADDGLDAVDCSARRLTENLVDVGGRRGLRGRGCGGR